MLNLEWGLDFLEVGGSSGCVEVDSYKNLRRVAGSRREALERFGACVSARFPKTEGESIGAGDRMRFEWEAIVGDRFSVGGVALLFLGQVGIPSSVEGMRISTYHLVSKPQGRRNRFRLLAGMVLEGLGFFLLLVGIAVLVVGLAFALLADPGEGLEGERVVLILGGATVVLAPMIRRIGFLVRVPRGLRRIADSPFYLVNMKRC